MLSAMRTPSVLALAVPLLLLLSACTPGTADDVTPPPSTPSPTTSEVAEPAIDLPDDAVLGLATTATAGNGAVLDVTIVVHQAVPAIDAAAATAVAATEAWCSGEMDGQILTDQGYTLTTVDVTATLVTGEWPESGTLLVYPEPRPNIVMTASGDILVQSPTGSQGDYTPHCVTPVTFLGPGSGTSYIGIGGDADGDGDGTPPLGGWAHLTWGLNVGLPDGTVAPITFSDCTVVVTDLGASLGGGTGSDWNEFVDDPAVCAAGGGQG
jgi:hypothetical protein